MGPVIMAITGDKHVLDCKQQGHEFMAPVRRQAENIAHDHFKGDDGYRQKGHPDHLFSDKDLGLFDGAHKFFQTLHDKPSHFPDFLFKGILMTISSCR